MKNLQKRFHFLDEQTYVDLLHIYTFYYGEEHTRLSPTKMDLIYLILLIERERGICN